MATSAENHGYMIVWLDKNVAEPESYRVMKKAFSTTVNPESDEQTSLIEHDIGNFIKEPSAQAFEFQSTPSDLTLFDDIDKCHKCLLANGGKKRIFFITSGDFGQYIIPKLLEHDPQIFQDKNGKFYEASIYVFCANMAKHAEWLMDYEELNCIKMERDERLILCWLTKDIAEYFLLKGKEEIRKDGIESARKACQYFNWSRGLYIKADTVFKGGVTKDLLAEIDELIKTAEAIIKANDD